jgi:hypothetical protein
MIRPFAVVVCSALLFLGGQKTSEPADLSYTPDGRMNFPENYREWVYLSSGLGMSYSAGVSDHLMFDNVFVNPTAYKAFLATGTWPDKTVLVLELRGSETKASIDQRGNSQSPEVTGVEVHVRDETLPGKWGFFEFDGHAPAKITARPAACYTCHEAHAAVDTTFVQFYPTLIGLAKEKKTLSAAYLKEMPAAQSTNRPAKR